MPQLSLEDNDQMTPAIAPGLPGLWEDKWMNSVPLSLATQSLPHWRSPKWRGKESLRHPCHMRVHRVDRQIFSGLPVVRPGQIIALRTLR